MLDTTTTDLPACASPTGASLPPSLTADAGAQTGRPVAIRAVPRGEYTHPSTVEVTIDGVTTIVLVDGDRDDWELPDCDESIAHRVLWAIDEAVERFLLELPESRQVVECRAVVS